MKTHAAISLVDAFKALGDPTRLRLARLILRAEKPLCVCEMVDALQLPQYQVSRHLATLKQSGLMTTNRIGTWVYYDVDRRAPELENIRRCLEEETGDEEHTADMARLEKRLALRARDICVVGLSPEERTNGKRSS